MLPDYWLGGQSPFAMKSSMQDPNTIAASVAAALLAVVLASPGAAATRTYVGGNNNWGTSGLNWSDGDEPDHDDVAIFNSNVSVDLVNASESINGLTISASADLDLNGNDLSVNGLVQLSDASTNLLIPTGSLLTLDALTINSGATLAMRGGAVTVIEEFGDG
jgi:hypothetical protein